MPWNLTSDRPIFAQIMDIISQDIISGKYSPGEKLPSVRDLANQASVNPNTMQKALSGLENTGLVSTHRTSGRFITEDKDRIEKFKFQLANKRIMEFLENMEKLGISHGDTMNLMTEILKREKNA